MISTKGRYALRVLLDVACNQQDGYVPMKDVAKRQGLSLKYIEQILPALTRNGILEGVPGKGGGYRLVVEPKKLTVGDILRITESNLAPVSCLQAGAKECKRRSICPTIDFWQGLNKVINDYIDSKTIEDLLKNGIL